MTARWTKLSMTEHQTGFRPEPTLKATGRSSPLADLYMLARRSNARLARRTRASAPIAPTICRPIGRPARVSPQRMEAEWPAQTGSPARHPYDLALTNKL